MSLVGLSLDAEAAFRSKRDPNFGNENATVFKVGTLTSRMQAHIRDRATDYIPDGNTLRVSVSANAANIETVKYGLRGWANFKDAAGNEIAFKTVGVVLGGVTVQVVADECLNRLPLWLVGELAAEINGFNDPVAQEAKN